MLPNASQRITDSTIKAMISMLFMFNSLDERVDISKHPKYHIVINDVSRYGEDYDPDKIDMNLSDASNNSATNLTV